MGMTNAITTNYIGGKRFQLVRRDERANHVVTMDTDSLEQAAFWFGKTDIMWSAWLWDTLGEEPLLVKKAGKPVWES